MIIQANAKKRIMPLDGRWEITGFPPPGGPAEPIHISGTVPGQVHTDLEAAGHIPPPFWRDQAEQCQWVENWDWRYRREFVLPEGFPTQHARLEFDGLDTFARIRLNGTLLGETDNMFVPQEFEAGPSLLPGNNCLEVRFTAPSKAIAGKSYKEFAACFSQDRVRVRRMQCGFGWDWVHRFLSMGIWRSVRLVSFAGARIADVFVCTQSIENTEARLHVELAVERFDDAPASARVEVLDPDGQIAFAQVIMEAAGEHSLETTLREARLWWPNGHGDQPLYTCRTTLFDADGSVVDFRETVFGIRMAVIEEIPDDISSSFTVVINGRRVFAKGGNWVSADPFPARITPEKYERLLRLAREGNINMLRAWGGGIYEPEAFWNICDRMGIMILQDFLLACAEYPENEPDFLEALRREFGAAIRQLRNHPSLIIWSGDNELGMNQGEHTAYNGRRIAEEVTGPLCAQLDSSRPFMPTSPYRGNPNNAPNTGDCHISAWYDPEFLASDMTEYRARISDKWGRFMSEYVAVGAPPVSSLRKFASEADLHDPAARIIEFHTKDNPYNGIDDATHYQLLRRTAERLYGAHDDPLTMIRRMEYVQYEFVRLAAENARRRKFDCSGLLFWMYNDCWPANGLSLVDYWGFAKAGYYAMRNAFQPVIACLEPHSGAVLAHVVNDAPHAVACQAAVCFQPWSGPPRWSRARPLNLAANGVSPAFEVPLSKIGADGVLVCDVASPEGRDRSMYYAGMPRDMNLPPAGLRVSGAREKSGGTITVTTENYARVVCFDAEADFSDNYFDLLPGEEKTITWRAVHESVPERIQVLCWNDLRVFSL